MMFFKKKVISDFKPHKSGLRKVLGDLEADIMEAVWKSGQATVREVYEQLRLERSIAYTTVMTVMGRLAEKKLLKKETKGSAYIYIPALSQRDFQMQIVSEVLDGLMEDLAEPAISHLVDRLSNEDADKIARLEKLLKEKRIKGGE